MLLEYADRGSLEDYFRRVVLPSNGEDIIEFWSRVFKIIDALAAIHKVEPEHAPSGSQTLHGYI
jgi:hypothetical protein